MDSLKLKDFIIVIFSGFTTLFAQTALQKDSVTMQASYAEEVYYSFTTGMVSSVPRNQWDIAFRTNIMSSGILINDGVGVVLYTYPNGDSSVWSAAWDTAGISTWTPMYNDPTDWENGAFSRNATGHPDYGWGVYNSITHDLRGDSCFLIKTRDGSFKRIFIARKISVDNQYIFRTANLDGTNSVVTTFTCTPYMAKDFVGYDLQNMQVVDFQPAKDSWDILFTKYMSVQPDGSPYAVTGVLNNDGVGANKYAGVPLAYPYWGVQEFDFGRSPIGWDWKYFDMGTFTYAVEDSLVFFVQNQNGDVAKIYFTKFAGSSSGKIVFYRGFVSATGTEDVNKESDGLTVFPNPASSMVNFNLLPGANGDARFDIREMTGRVVWTGDFKVIAGQAQSGMIDVSSLASGVYLFNYVNGDVKQTHKLIIQK